MGWDDLESQMHHHEPEPILFSLVFFVKFRLYNTKVEKLKPNSLIIGSSLQKWGASPNINCRISFINSGPF